MNRKTKAAIAKYTEAGCIKAYQLNVSGWGPSGIALNYSIQGVNTVAAANAAINCGRILSREFALVQS
jgi:hypothetical protein